MEVISYIVISALGAFVIAYMSMSGYICYLYVSTDERRIAQQIENPPLPITVPLRFYVQAEVPNSIIMRRNVITVEANKHNYTLPITIDESLFKVIEEEKDDLSMPNGVPLAIAVII